MDCLAALLAQSNLSWSLANRVTSLPIAVMTTGMLVRKLGRIMREGGIDTLEKHVEKITQGAEQQRTDSRQGQAR